MAQQVEAQEFVCSCWGHEVLKNEKRRVHVLYALIVRGGEAGERSLHTSASAIRAKARDKARRGILVQRGLRRAW